MHIDAVNKEVWSGDRRDRWDQLQVSLTNGTGVAPVWKKSCYSIFLKKFVIPEALFLMVVQRRYSKRKQIIMLSSVQSSFTNDQNGFYNSETLFKTFTSNNVSKQEIPLYDCDDE